MPHLNLNGLKEIMERVIIQYIYVPDGLGKLLIKDATYTTPMEIDVFVGDQ